MDKKSFEFIQTCNDNSLSYVQQARKHENLLILREETFYPKNFVNYIYCWKKSVGDPLAKPISYCRFQTGDLGFSFLYKKDNHGEIVDSKKVIKGAYLEVLDHPPVTLAGLVFKGVRVRVVENKTEHAAAAIPGEILYTTKLECF